MKNALKLSLAAVILPAASQAALITNGNLNTTVTADSSNSGSSEFSLDANGVVRENGGNANINNRDTGFNANEWVLTSLTRGFDYSATGGDTGEGGAFVEGVDFNGNIRSVLFFADDSSATTGEVDITLDVFSNDITGFSFVVELYAWDDGETGVALSAGGNNSGVYNVTNLGDADTLVNSVSLTPTAASTWETVTIASDLNLGTGYDFYAWRIGVLGAESGADFAIDNLVVIPEPGTYGLLAGLSGLAFVMLRRRK